MNLTNKVILLGDSGVGKSTLGNTLCGNFNGRPQSTIGCAIQVRVYIYELNSYLNKTLLTKEKNQ